MMMMLDYQLIILLIYQLRYYYYYSYVSVLFILTNHGLTVAYRVHVVVGP